MLNWARFSSYHIRPCENSLAQWEETSYIQRVLQLAKAVFTLAWSLITIKPRSNHYMLFYDALMPLHVIDDVSCHIAQCHMQCHVYFCHGYRHKLCDHLSMGISQLLVKLLVFVRRIAIIFLFPGSTYMEILRPHCKLRGIFFVDNIMIVHKKPLFIVLYSLH